MTTVGSDSTNHGSRRFRPQQGRIDLQVFTCLRVYIRIGIAGQQPRRSARGQFRAEAAAAVITLIAFPTLLGIAADPLLLAARKCERECSFRTHFYSSKENMKHVNLWLLIALLGVGSLLGCSKVYTTAPVSSSIRKPFEVGPETTKGKPSACIKWVRGSGRTSKLLRKAVRISDPAAAAVDREKKLQADNEDHPQ